MQTRKLISQNGFSLMELLVVLVIIGLLAGLVGPQLFKRVDESRQKTAETQVKMLKGALETMYLDIGRFPSNEEGLLFLNKAPTGNDTKTLWRGPYLSDDLPLDPWNKPYQYQTFGNSIRPFYLYSLGADGKQGGEGLDKDVGYVPPQ